MNRMTFGAALGGAAVYLLDPQQGEARRRRVQSLWSDGRGAARQVERRVSESAETMLPVVQRVDRGLRRGDWSSSSGSNRVAGMTGVLMAAAVGGALVYLLEPTNGALRRRRIVAFLGRQRGALQDGFRSARRTARQAAGKATRNADRAAGNASERVGSVRVHSGA
jgi:gas vesicle protein